MYPKLLLSKTRPGQAATDPTIVSTTQYNLRTARAYASSSIDDIPQSNRFLVFTL